MRRDVSYGDGREALVSATVSVVADVGLRGMTLRAVADRAGVSNALIVHHFGSRQLLLVAALEWAVNTAIETTHLAEVILGDATAAEFIRSISEYPELHAFQSEMILEARRNEAFRSPIRELYARYETVAEDAVRRLGIVDSTAAAARRAFAFLDGVVLQHMAGVDGARLAEAVRDLQRELRERAGEQGVGLVPGQVAAERG